MWSKQAAPADVVRTNKNGAASFRSKITNRKGKGGKEEKIEEEEKSENKKKPAQITQQTPQRCGNGRNRNRSRKKSENGNEKKEKEMCNKLVSAGDVVTVVVDTKGQDEPDVVLRSDLEKQKAFNNALKRYSDSYVIENGDTIEKDAKTEKIEPPPLTRAVSGFFVVDHARKARRFSDLFRGSSTMKLSGSTESLKVEKVAFPPSKDIKNIANNNAKNKKADKKVNVASNGSAKTNPTAAATTEPSNSYLKRVRSKIYKSKSDDASKIELDKKKGKGSKKSVSGIIPEDEVAILSPPGLTKSLAHFDYRLTRQTSNLESVRPAQSRASFDGADLDRQMAPPAKPLLAKAKSSSAINLNLLRTRRTKILEQVAARRQATAAMNVKDEFDFIAFGSVGKLTGSTTSLHKFPSWLHVNKVAEEGGRDEADSSRPGQPVSRSGSDRRPDSVKEEGGRCEGTAAPSAASDGALDGDAVKETAATDSSVSLPASGNRRKVGSNINRSESWKESSEKRKQKRNISDPSHNASGDVDLEKQGLTNTDSGSSSHSSLSCNGRLSESPSSNSVVGEPLARVKSLSDTETDLDDGEADPLNWQERVPEEELKKLDQQELKRQDVINELFSTEASHVRNLKVLYKVFYKRLSQSSTLKPDELALIFPNLKDVLDLHAAASDDMRRKRRDDPIVRELGELLVRMFCGPQGEELKRASALFCERQRLALELITRRRERDSKFDAALAECEKKRQCRRLPLQGILPTQMQRLSKYPLLLERLIGVAAAAGAAAVDEEELRRLRKAHDASKEILHFVNEAAKVAMNKHRLEDIQKRLDTSAFERADHEIVREFKSLDLTRYKLVLEGNMQLRRPNKGVVPVHVLLLEEMVVILHREGDRFTLKFFQSGTPAAPQPLSPIIKMNSLLVRINAVSKDALFLVNTATSNCQMYDLIAESESKREEWFRNFSDAGDVYNRREGGKPSRHKQPSAAGGAAGGAAAPGRAPTPPADEPAAGGGGGEEETVRDLPADSESEPGRAEPAVEGEGPARDAAEPEGADAAEGRSREEGMVVRGDGDAVGVQTRVTAEDWPLVQPSQIVVSAPPVLTAERILTPLEQIRRKDLEVREALAAKEGLVADLLSIPREHYHTIADMAGDNALMAPKDLAERVMASMFQVDLLQKAVNDALNITESDSIEAKGGKPVCASQEAPEKPKIPSVPATVVKDIAASLSLQLITLLNDVKQVEEERDRLRREVDRFREQIHEQYHLHDGVSQEDEPPDDTEADVEAAGAAENADEAEAPAKGCDKEEVFYETSSDNQ